MNKFIAVDAKECIGCHACEVACAVAHNQQCWPDSAAAFHSRIQVVFRHHESVAVTCRHCNHAPCVGSCPVDALTFQHDHVHLDESLCIGCKNCVMACPFGAIEMVQIDSLATRLAQKCDLCEQSETGQPACVTCCPTDALKLMDDAAINELRQRRQSATARGDVPLPPRRQTLLNKPGGQGADKLAADVRKTHFGEIYQGLTPQQAQKESARCLYCAQKAWCNWTCPLHNAIPDLVRLVNEGKIIEAAELSHQSSSLPEICGRVCPQDRLCEGACTLKAHSDAVSIGNLERYITDTAFAQGWRPTVSGVTVRKERVAVIGAGPAGLGCADILTRRGVQVDVYDRHPEIGGLLTFGIPPFKLDKKLLTQRREIFSSMGMTFHLGCEIGRDIGFDELLSQYDAVFLGVGTYKFMRAGLEHEESPGVVQALPLLNANIRRVMGLEDDTESPWIELQGKKVVVLGGGDTAMDCLRTSVRRQAASVTCAYRRDEVSMPGSKKEVTNAKEEGVEFLFNVQPQFIERNRKGAVTGVGLIRTQMGGKGKDGRRRPQPIAGSEFVLPTDVLVMAFGFHPHEMPWLRTHQVSFDNDGLIETGQDGRLSTQTSNPKVFAGGDAVHSADLVVTAMVAGRQAADDIIALLNSQTTDTKLQPQESA